MAWDAWFVLVIVLFCFGLMATNRFSPDLILMGCLTLLLVSGIVSPAQALAGFSNEGVVTVAVLYIVVTGFR
ncbi:MAG: SLC13 family permease, partial [Arenicellales bacterium]